MAAGSGVCVCVLCACFPISVGMVVGPLVCHGVDGGKCGLSSCCLFPFGNGGLFRCCWVLMRACWDWFRYCLGVTHPTNIKWQETQPL